MNETTGSIDIKALPENCIENTVIVQPLKKKVVGRPFKKGAEWNGNKKGKPKGTVQLKDLTRKTLTKKDAQLVVNNIISGSIQGFDSKQDRLLKLTGDFEKEQVQVNITNNSLIIPPDIIELAKQRALDKMKNITGIKSIEDSKDKE